MKYLKSFGIFEKRKVSLPFLEECKILNKMFKYIGIIFSSENKNNINGGRCICAALMTKKEDVENVASIITDIYDANTLRLTKNNVYSSASPSEFVLNTIRFTFDFKDKLDKVFKNEVLIKNESINPKVNVGFILDEFLKILNTEISDTIFFTHSVESGKQYRLVNTSFFKKLMISYVEYIKIKKNISKKKAGDLFIKSVINDITKVIPSDIGNYVSFSLISKIKAKSVYLYNALAKFIDIEALDMGAEMGNLGFD